MLLATSGPSNPRINVLHSANGKSVKEVSLPCPCFGLSRGSGGGYQAYLLPDERERSSTVATLSPDLEIRGWEELPSCCSKVKHSTGMELLFSPGQLHVRKGFDGDWMALETEGTPFDAQWCEESKMLVLLVQNAKQVFLQRWLAHESLVLDPDRKAS
jgi:hypothetical protein